MDSPPFSPTQPQSRTVEAARAMAAASARVRRSAPVTGPVGLGNDGITRPDQDVSRDPSLWVHRSWLLYPTYNAQNSMAINELLVMIRDRFMLFYEGVDPTDLKISVTMYKVRPRKLRAAIASSRWSRPLILDHFIQGKKSNDEVDALFSLWGELLGPIERIRSTSFRMQEDSKGDDEDSNPSEAETIKQDEPVAKQDESAAKQDEPAAKQDEPVAKQDEPVAKKSDVRYKVVRRNKKKKQQLNSSFPLSNSEAESDVLLHTNGQESGFQLPVVSGEDGGVLLPTNGQESVFLLPVDNREDGGVLLPTNSKEDEDDKDEDGGVPLGLGISFEEDPLQTFQALEIVESSDEEDVHGGVLLSE